jgi:hypothetical protein
MLMFLIVRFYLCISFWEVYNFKQGEDKKTEIVLHWWLASLINYIMHKSTA